MNGRVFSRIMIANMTTMTHARPKTTHATKKGEINHGWGGRGVYWADPDGHWLEILTRPYGSNTP